jgi:hypothetical protein
VQISGTFWKRIRSCDGSRAGLTGRGDCAPHRWNMVRAKYRTKHVHGDSIIKNEVPPTDQTSLKLYSNQRLSVVSGLVPWRFHPKLCMQFSSLLNSRSPLTIFFNCGRFPKNICLKDSGNYKLLFSSLLTNLQSKESYIINRIPKTISLLNHACSHMIRHAPSHHKISVEWFIVLKSVTVLYLRPVSG